MLFALVLVPILLTVGLSVDYGHASTFQLEIQRTLDEAALAGANELAKSGDASRAERVTKRRFEATRPTRYPVALAVVVDQQKGFVQTDAEAEVPMTFMAIAGYDKISVHAHSVASAKPASIPGRRQRSTTPVKSLSDQDLRDVIYRVEQVCYKLRGLGYANSVPQCAPVFDGTFEQKLRAELAATGNAGGLLPGGVRLVK